MLSTKEIADRIQKPELIHKEDISFLKELSENHPYTQIYSILYLKGLGDNADIHFEQELQKHSCRIGDRAQLYKLIHDFSPSSIDSIHEEEKNEIPVIDDNGATETKLETIKLEKAPETIEEIDIKLEVSETNVITEQEETITKEEKTEAEESSIKDDKVIEENMIHTPSDSLDESILHHSFASNYQLKELSEEEIEALQKREEEEKSELIIEKTVQESPTEIEINSSQSFTSWLNSNKNKIDHSNDERIEIESIVNDSSLEFEINEFFGEVVKPKKEFFSPIKKAKESLSEEALPVSETLAKVYALQGNFPKAIYAYEQLSLKYPEKKIFFAIQIKELQKKLNT